MDAISTMAITVAQINNPIARRRQILTFISTSSKEPKSTITWVHLRVVIKLDEKNEACTSLPIFQNNMRVFFYINAPV